MTEVKIDAAAAKSLVGRPARTIISASWQAAESGTHRTKGTCISTSEPAMLLIGTKMTRGFHSMAGGIHKLERPL